VSNFFLIKSVTIQDYLVYFYKNVAQPACGNKGTSH